MAHSAWPQIAKFIGPIWGPSGPRRPQMGSVFSPWTLLSGTAIVADYKQSSWHRICKENPSSHQNWVPYKHRWTSPPLVQIMGCRLSKLTLYLNQRFQLVFRHSVTNWSEYESQCKNLTFPPFKYIQNLLPNECLSHSLIIIYWAVGKALRWNHKHSATFFFHKNAFENHGHFVSTLECYVSDRCISAFIHKYAAPVCILNGLPDLCCIAQPIKCELTSDISCADEK